MCLLPRDPRLPGRVVLHYGSLHLPESGEKQRNKGKILWVFFFLISVFPVPEKKWLNGRESDSKPPYSAEVQKGWRFISTHSYVCVMWCYSFVFVPLNFCVSRPEKWLNRGEADSKPPYSAEVQKGWRFISTHCYVCVLWCYSFVFVPLNFCVSRPEKWLNRGEADSKPPYSAKVQKVWRLISTHSYVCVLWCYSFVSFLLISVFPGQKSG